MKQKTPFFFGTSKNINPTKRSHSPEDLNPQRGCGENLKFHLVSFVRVSSSDIITAHLTADILLMHLVKFF
jgi:hypothetical protein